MAPPDAELARSAAEAAVANDGTAVFACARMAAKRVADPALFAEVPCMARVDESMVLSLVSHGAMDVLLVDGNCATCKYGACDAAIAETVEQANRLLEVHGSAVRVRRASAFPDSLLADDTQGMYGATRRGFFSDAAGAAKDTVVTAARTTIEQELGYGDKRSIAERLRASDAGDIVQVGLGGSLSFTTLTTENTAYIGDEASESEFMGSSFGIIANVKYYLYDNLAIVPFAKIYENWFRNVYTEASGLCDLDSYMWQTFFFVGVNVQFQF